MISLIFWINFSFFLPINPAHIWVSAAHIASNKVSVVNFINLATLSSSVVHPKPPLTHIVCMHGNLKYSFLSDIALAKTFLGRALSYTDTNWLVEINRQL
jgi:hypothetical protein